jgi:ribose transport system permease protein
VGVATGDRDATELAKVTVAEQSATGTPETPEPPRDERGSGARFLAAFQFSDAHRLLIRYVTLIGFVAMFALFSALEPDVFPTWDNIRSILDLSAPILILAVGLTVVLVVGEFDLSFTGLVGLCAVVAVKLQSSGGTGAGVAVLAGLGVGLGGGIIAGTLVSFQRASSFIVTLALGSIWSGVALGITGGGLTIANVTTGYTNLTDKDIAGIPLAIFYAGFIVLAIWAVLRWTVFGREAQAIGANPTAARLAGIRLSTTRIAAFAVLGLCAAIAAIILSSRSGQYSPDIASGLFIPPFVAAFFGMSVLAAGRFNVFGTLVGALFIATLQTGLVVLGSQDWVANVIIGSVLLIILFIAAETRDTG